MELELLFQHNAFKNNQRFLSQQNFFPSPDRDRDGNRRTKIEMHKCVYLDIDIDIGTYLNIGIDLNKDDFDCIEKEYTMKIKFVEHYDTVVLTIHQLLN